MARPRARSQVRARPAADQGTDGVEGRRTGEGQSLVFWKVLVFSRGGFSQEFAWPASGVARWRFSPPLLAEQVAGSSGFRRGPAPGPPALRPPRRAGLSRLLRKGKARAPSGAGWERVRPGLAQVLRGSRAALACPINPAAQAGEAVPGQWLLSGRPRPQRVARLLGTRRLQRSRPREAGSLPFQRMVGWNF